MPDRPIHILGIDPSVQGYTGLALLAVTPQRIEGITAYAAAVATRHHPDRQTERDWRIAEVGQTIVGWLAAGGRDSTALPPVSVVAIEEPYFPTGKRTQDGNGWSVYNYSTLTLLRACGHYHCLPGLSGAIHYDIPIPTAKAVYGGSGLPREQAKREAVAYARRDPWRLPLDDSEAAEAIADALSVAHAAYNRWREAWWAARGTRPMFGPGSRPRKELSHV